MRAWWAEAVTGGLSGATWRDPTGGEAYAVGSVHPLRGSWDAVAARCSEIAERLAVAARPCGGPRVWLGRAFGDALPGACSQWGDWSGWPAAAALVPRLEVRLEPAGGATLTATATVSRAGRGVHERLNSALAQLAARLLPSSAGGTDRQGELAAPQPDPAARRAYERRVAQALAAIRGGELEKVVVARAARWQLAPAFSLAALMTRLWRQQPDALGFAFAPGGAGVLLGASPERLLRAHAGAVATHALAGTAPRAREVAQEAALAAALQACPKTAREHALVVEAIRARLGACCVAIEAAPAPRLRWLPGLLHLETPLRGRLRPGVSPLEAAAALHPTPAMAGWPYAAAREWLARHDQLERGWFAAPVGWVGPGGEVDLAVAIRSALIRGGTLWGFAGAGIVAGSDPAAEWAETELKLAPLRRALSGEGAA